MQEIGGLTVGLQMTPGGSRALFGTPSSSGELLRSSSRGLYYETSGSSRRLNGNAGSSRALLLTPLRDGPLLIGKLWSLDGFLLVYFKVMPEKQNCVTFEAHIHFLFSLLSGPPALLWDQLRLDCWTIIALSPFPTSYLRKAGAAINSDHSLKTDFLSPTKCDIW